MGQTDQGAKMKRVDRWLSLGLVLILGCLLGMLGFSLWDKVPPSVERVAWSPEAQWIASQEPSYRFYTRHTFYLADPVQAAWLRLSADNDFILYVNGSVVTQEISILRSSMGLGSKLREPYQDFNDSLSYRIPSFPEYWITNARDWKLSTYIDLTPYLRPGKNAIALEVQKSRKNPRVVVEGAVYPVQGASPINLTTGATPWQVSTLSESHQGVQWFDKDFPDQNWSEAKAINPVQEATYSRLSQHLFDRFLEGSWIAGTESPQGEVWLRREWQMPETRKRAFIRFSGDGEYALLINGLLVKRFGVGDRNQLHLYEVTNFLHTGLNTLAVRLARPLDPDWSPTQKGSLIKNGALGFFLDGWVETPDNSITAPISTDSAWSALTTPIPGWAEGTGQGQPATLLGPPDLQEFQRKFEGNAYLLNYPDFLWHSSLWQLGGMGCALVYAWGLGRFWLGRQNGWWDSLGAGTGLLIPGTLYLIGIGLLKHRYAEAERGFLFAQSQSTPLICLGFVGVVLLTMLWSKKGQRLEDKCALNVQALPRWGLWFLVGLIACVSLSFLTKGIAFSWLQNIFLAFLSFGGIVTLPLLGSGASWSLKDSFKAVLKAWPSWGQWFLLVLIVGIGFGLRAYDLGFIDLDADENTSFDAIRGILRTGAPEPASHIWYTRGPAYHYMVALWLRLIGDSAANARFLSCLWGTATLVLIFIFTRKITGKSWLALGVTAILALDPSEIWYSRYIRFYPVLQCMILLSFWLFFKGFIERCGRSYQYCFFIALTFGLLNQEVSILLLPCFFIGFLFFYRPFRWSVDWPIVVSSLMTLMIYVYNGLFFSIRTLTPWVALSKSTASYLKLHVSDISQFVSIFFVGPNRMHTIYSFFFFMGFIYFLKGKNEKIILLFISVLLSLILLTLTTYQVAPRYTYSVYPLFILLSLYSAFHIIKSLGLKFEFILKNLLPLKNIAVGCLFLLLINNIEPNRVLAAYQDAFNKRNTEAYEYIREHRQPGDIVISPTPFPAAIVLRGVDYYFLMPAFRSSADFAFDTVYMHEGKVIDRWAGGVVISNVDKMSHLLEKANRAWILIDDNKLEGDAITPELANYSKSLGKTVMETFGTRLRLWRQEDGLLPRVPNQGRDLGAY